MNENILTNTRFAREDELFRKACEIAGIKPTSRQASKWRNERGLAYQFRAQARFALQEQFAGRSA